jgi:uncharacterized membrane protein YczE
VVPVPRVRSPRSAATRSPAAPSRRRDVDAGRLARYVGGLFLGAFGMVLVIRARLGSAPWEVGIDGLARVSGASVPAVRFVVLAAFVAVAVALRVRLRPALLATGVLWASFAALHDALVPDLDGGAARMAAFALGLVVLSVGVAVHLDADLGAGPADAIVQRLTERGDRPVWLVRSSFELVGFGLGVALGGLAGVGSLVYALAVGPLIAVVMRALGRRPAVDDTAVLGGGGLVPVPSAPRRALLERWRRRPAPAAALAADDLVVTAGD